MILGMMQPYFYPYLGYWQLMNAVDEYIIYDDVNFIKGGWIHRNRIKINGEPQYFSLTIRKASQNKKINELELNMDENAKKNLLNKVRSAYGKAPYFKEAFEVFERTILYEETNLASFLAYCNREVAKYLGITTPIYTCTELQLDNSLKFQDRILDICSSRGDTGYINAIGGKELYSHAPFDEIGCPISFLRMNDDIVYPQQGSGEFLPGLSILDIMMNNSQEEIHRMLERYTIEQ